MNYKDKLFIIILVLYLFIGDVNIRAVLLLSACFISLEYPLKHRKAYFIIIIIYTIIMFCMGFIIGYITSILGVALIFETSSDNYVGVILIVSTILSLYYRDNEDFIFREKIKNLKKDKEKIE